MRLLLAFLLASSSVTFAQLAPNDVGAPQEAMKTVRADSLRAHMRFLTDGLLQGRAAGTSGYDIASAYIATQMEAMGLKAAGVNGSWFQPVPLRRFQVVPAQTSLELVRNGKTEALVFGKDYVTDGDPEHSDTVLDAPVIFVGYGVTAPELKYDDYVGLDVRGKVVVMLWGAPSRFPSVQRAYFSDLVNKERSAVERGAVGFLVVLTPEDQKRFPRQWLVPQIQAGGMKWLEPGGGPHDSFPQLRGGMLLLSQHGAELLFAAAPKSLEQVFASTSEAKIDHFALPVTLKMHAVTQHAEIQSPNIVGALFGSDPKLRQEYVVYSAHLDHLGICPAVNGDNVCHGAFDNASGVAALLEIAHAYTTIPQPPRRSILFVFVTGEEKGLLGSDYFATHPTVARDAIVADINIDGAPGILYPMKDIVALGAEDSSLAEDVKLAARQMELEVSPDPMPEEVFFVRGDQYSFVRQGVPSIFILEGWKSADPKLNGEEIFKKWLVTAYHTPRDNMTQSFDFDSGAKGARLNFLLGYEVAQQLQRPRWNIGNFFGVKFARAEQ